jgi:hypothetical protein
MLCKLISSPPKKLQERIGSVYGSPEIGEIAGSPTRAVPKKSRTGTFPVLATYMLPFGFFGF